MKMIAATTATMKTDEADDDEEAELALVHELRGSSPTADGRAGDDAGEDDQRDAVADAALGDLLAEPHDERGARA